MRPLRVVIEGSCDCCAGSGLVPVKDFGELERCPRCGGHGWHRAAIPVEEFFAFCRENGLVPVLGKTRRKKR